MDDLTLAHMTAKATSAQVTLRAIDDHSKRIRELDRVINLDILNHTFTIGRASKVESKGYIAAKGNAWYDNAVMSRRHAEIKAHFGDKRLEIIDLGSLHGTFLQPSLQDKLQPLRPTQPYQIMNGDELQFGVPVHRSEDRFEPVSLAVGIKWSGEPSPTFQVPDGSDDGSDMESNFIDLTKVSSGTPPPSMRTIPLSTRTIPPFSTIFDLSSSPPSPSSVKQDGDQYNCESDSEGSDTPPHPSTEPLRQAFGARFVSQDCILTIPPSQDDQRPLSWNSDIDDHDNSGIDLTSDADDGDATDVESVSSVGETDSENGREEDEEDEEDDELGMNDPELDEVDWMSDGVYDDDEVRDGEVRDGEVHGEAHDGVVGDGKGPTVEADSDNDSDYGFWAPRPEDRFSITRILNGDAEIRAHQTSTVQSRMSGILPELSSDRAAPADLEVIATKVVVGGPKHSSSVHNLCNTPRHHITDYIDEAGMTNYPPVNDQALHKTTDHAAPPTTNVGYPPADPASVFSASLADYTTYHAYSMKTEAAQSDMDEARRGWGLVAPSRLSDFPPTKKTKRTHVGIRDIVDVEPFEALQKPRSKRKVDDISTLNQEESAWTASHVTEVPKGPALSDASPSEETTSTMGPALSGASPSGETTSTRMDASSDTGVQTEVAENKQTPAQVPALSEATSSVSAVEDLLSQRPAKRQRMRDIAERVGYAALGGVTAGAMIVGTLIYTAPTFA